MQSLKVLMLSAANFLAVCSSLWALEPCRIRVVDAENGWPVPLVELRTVHDVSFYSDNAGVVAFDLPELMGVETWFHVSADGYEVAKDGFGYRGVRLTPQPGGDLTVEVNRTMLAKRLGRLTGAGLFGESQRFGEYSDWKESGVLGSDSVQNAIYQGRMFWAWGDTNLPGYPLGRFHMVSATTAIQALQSFEPPLQLPLNYFRDDQGKVRNVAEIEGQGPTWINGYVSLPDAEGKEWLVGCYSKIRPPLEVYRYGLCVWDDETARFQSLQIIWDKADGDPEPTKIPLGHPVIWEDPQGKSWVLFGDPLPVLRCPATYEAWQDPKTWEVLEPQASFDSADGRKVKPHRGSIAWNGYRQRWITVFCEVGGDPTFLGEIWYAEADSPLGPWGKAVKVLTHQEHSFYNPRIHPEFTPEDSPILLFEGTYTQTFSKAKTQTPRHNYNQILYRLDLDDPGLGSAREN